MNTPTILLLGGYGAVGRVVARLLLHETEADIIIAGRSKEKADALTAQLQAEFQGRVRAAFADAAKPETLKPILQDVQLLMVLSTTPEYSLDVAKEALAAGCDYLDILVSESSFQNLQSIASEISQSGRTFIAQAGFHPGLPAPFIRLAAPYLDEYQSAVVAMTMNARFERGEQAHEIIDMIADFNAEVFQDGTWSKASYNAYRKIDMGIPFGVVPMYPMAMSEIRPEQERYQLQEAAVYVSGFNRFVDYVVMPLIWMTQKLHRGFMRKVLCRLFAWGVNQFASPYQGVVFLVDAMGLKDGYERHVRIKATHDDAYFFTAMPIVACVHQYLRGGLPKGLWRMGTGIHEDTLIADLRAMGALVSVSVENKDTVSPMRELESLPI
ncbi:MAG: saccharopine dehydrogenase NADP-binding domain-containing protein [Cyclobacteriaceae bacterium]|nr:saccharopine dehydrogenase NADP-binding domain-containing protein [Cyclobacteriaceae bacterium]